MTFPVPLDVVPDIAKEYRFAHGDRMAVQVYTFPESHRDSVVVDPDGNISYLTVR